MLDLLQEERLDYELLPGIIESFAFAWTRDLFHQKGRWKNTEFLTLPLDRDTMHLLFHVGSISSSNRIFYYLYLIKIQD
jgi:hypothetical protein